MPSAWVWRSWPLIAQMIPGIIMAMGFYAVFLSTGVLNTVPGLIAPPSCSSSPSATSPRASPPATAGAVKA